MGHLQGVPAPKGATLVSATYAPGRTQVQVGDHACDKGLAKAYLQGVEGAEAAAMPDPEGQRVAVHLARPDGTVTVLCVPDATPDHLLIVGGGEDRADWNPWGTGDWRMGPLAGLPAIDAMGEQAFQPPTVTFTAEGVHAVLTPRKPGVALDRLGSALTDSGWIVRPAEGHTDWQRKGKVLRVSQQASRIDLRLTDAE